MRKIRLNDADFETAVNHVKDGKAVNGGFIPIGPAYVVQCMGCPMVFYGRSMGDALAAYRAHETLMIQRAGERRDGKD